MKINFLSTSNILLFTSSYINYYIIVNIIILILATLSITINNSYSKKENILILINIILELIFNYVLVFSNNIFILLLIKILQFIFSIHLNELIYLNKKSAKLFMPYILWNYLLTLLITVSIFLNISI